MRRPRHVTIDLDGAWCYRQIHGRDDDASDDDDDDDDDVLLQGLPRFLDLCARCSATATLFVVGHDLRNQRYARLIADAAGAGHEVMSHSHRHAYDLSRWPRHRIVEDLRSSIEAIGAVTGQRPEGFRAPGYNLSQPLLDAVAEVGLQWSSSLLPAPMYFGARAAVIAQTWVSGRRSASLVGDARAFFPRPRRRHANGILEYPLSAPWGIPFTGTLLALMNDRAADWLTSAALSDDDVSLELHAADFVEGTLLPSQQPDSGVPLQAKLGRIERAVQRLSAEHR